MSSYPSVARTQRKGNGREEKRKGKGKGTGRESEAKGRERDDKLFNLIAALG